MADAVAKPAARRSPLSEDDVRGMVGGLFLLLTAAYLWQAVTEMWAERR